MSVCLQMRLQPVKAIPKEIRRSGFPTLVRGFKVPLLSSNFASAERHASGSERQNYLVFYCILDIKRKISQSITPRLRGDAPSKQNAY